MPHDLTPSQRIHLLESISERLALKDWSVIDLTLEQFGLPCTNSWPGSKESYVLEMAKNAATEILQDLGLHLGCQVEVQEKSIEMPEFWQRDMFRLFISHLAAQRKYASDLQEALLRFGISSFVAHKDIEPTTEWQTEIERALSTCEGFVALLHKGFHQSNWTDQEIGFAMGRGVPVFSVRLGEDPYGFIGRFQAFNGIGKGSEGVAKELYVGYRKNKKARQSIGNAMVALFEKSDSFAEAKERVGYLEELESWDPSFSKRVLSAVEENSQVAGSWGVSGRVNGLVQRWIE